MVFKASSVQEYVLAQDLKQIQLVARKSEEVLTEIFGYMKAGVTESEILMITKDVFVKHGIKKSWHNPHIRFGEHTLLLSHEKNPQDLVLQETDIAFIDIGPIFGEIEGDFAKTVVLGDDEALHKLQKASEVLFDRALEYFRSGNPTGNQLHNYVCQQARSMGYEQVLERSGHMIGLFAHNAAWNKGLAAYEETMDPGLWVLEIQIKDAQLSRAAFYENILL
jgi:methionyl aminopeptidase